MKRGVKIIKRIFLGIFLSLFAYLFSAFLLSALSTSPRKNICSNNREVFLSTNGIHLDIIMPKKYCDINLGDIPSHINYLSFGWGDKGFYLETPTWDKLKFSTATNALFWKSETAMHLTMYRQVRKDWIKLNLCDEQLKKLIGYISNSFLKNHDGEIIEIEDAGYSNNDKFFEAIGSYNCISTCNSWVNEGLKTADVKTCIWSPFDKGVIYQVTKD